MMARESIANDKTDVLNDKFQAEDYLQQCNRKTLKRPTFLLGRGIYTIEFFHTILLWKKI
jgi:hypothetical protein